MPSEFGKAFAAARASGEKEFSFQGKRFHTRTKEEESKPAAKRPADVAKPRKPTVSRALPDPDTKTASDPSSVFQTIKAVLSLDENSPQLPSAFKKVKEEFLKAAQASGGTIKERQTPEADVERHLEGARNAAKEAGILPALIGSTAHEINNLLRVAFAETPSATVSQSAGGQEIGFGQALQESGQDIANNLRGIFQAGREGAGIF